MRLHIRLKFNDAERLEINKFSREIGMLPDEFCKRAVFYAINDAYRRAEEVQNAAGNNTSNGDIGTNNTEVSNSSGNSSAALSDQTDTSTQP